MSERSTRPISIIGTERSGSNLLRLMLDAHSRIAVPHPPHLMRYLAPIAGAYGDLRRVEARRRAARDAMAILRAHPHPWDIEVDREQVVAEAHPSVFGVVAAIYEQYRRAAGKPRWGCKSTFMVDHVDAVRALYPEARFVWLVRDPRDVAASSKESVFNPCHPRLTAELWARQQARGLSALARLGAGQVHLLRYERLVADPAGELARLCHFLGEAVEPAMLAHHVSPAASQVARLSESWRAAGGPVTEASVGRFARDLDPLETRMVEEAAGPLMDRLGYARAAARAVRGAPSMRRVRLENGLMRARVELRSLRRDRNHFRRWSRDATVLWLRARAAASGLSTLAAGAR